MSTINSFNGDPITVNRYFGYQDPTDSTRFKNVGDEFYNANTQVWFKAIGRTGNTYSWQAITTSPSSPQAAVTIVGYEAFDMTGESFPSTPGSPISAFADLQATSIPYSGAADTGFQISYQPKDIVNGSIFLDVTIPVYAEGLLTQELSQLMLAFYDQQGGSNPVMTMVTGTTGVASYSSVVNFKKNFSSGTYPNGLTLYLCAFFDSNVATADMQLVVNGFLSNNFPEAYAHQSLAGKFVETSPSNP